MMHTQSRIGCKKHRCKSSLSIAFLIIYWRTWKVYSAPMAWEHQASQNKDKSAHTDEVNSTTNESEEVQC
jgi:hypothetical protein